MKCRNCPTMLADVGPTRCPACAAKNNSREKARCLAKPDEIKRKAAEWRRANSEKLKEARKENYVSRCVVVVTPARRTRRWITV